MSKNYSCGTLLKQIHDIMEKNANNVLREQNLTISQSGVLVLLDEKEGKTASFKELDFFNSQQQKRYMIYLTSARILEVLRNVPGVLFIKITLFERQQVCDFYECI